MQKINYACLFFACLLCACAANPNGDKNTKSAATKVKETFNTMKESGAKLISKSGDKNPVIKDLAKQRTENKYAIGVENDLMNHRAQSYGIFDSSEINQYLSGLRQKLQVASGMTGVPGNIYVDASMAINALATADGNIFINWGMLKHLTSEDEVAAIVAHELAHVLLSHHDSNAVTDYERKAQFFHTQSVVISAVGRKVSNNQSGNIELGDLKSTEVSQLQKLHLLVKLSADILSPSWERTQEREADLLGVDLLIAAGYNPDGMLNMLSVLKQDEKNNAKEQDNKALLDNAFNVATHPDSFAKIDSSINLLKPFLGKNHADSQDRIDDVAMYLQKHYAEANTTGPYQIESWKKITLSPKLKKVIKAYDGAYAADKLLEQGKNKEALKIASSTIGSVKNHSYPAYIYSQALEKNNRNKEAEAILKNAVEHKEASGNVYMRLSETYANNGKYKEALAFSKKGHTKFGNSPHFLSSIIRYNRLSGNLQEANSLSNDCALNHTAYKDACTAALSSN